MEESQAPQEPVGQPEPERKRPSKLALTLVLAPIIAMTIAGYISSAFFPTLIKNHPLTLIVFDARARNLVLVTTQISLIAWFGVALVRRIIFHPLYFMLGRWYGDAAVHWINKRSPEAGQLITQIQAWFPRFGPVIVMFYAQAFVCVLAGASKMRMAPFIIYNIVGNIIELVIIWQFGEVFSTPLKGVTGFITQYSVPLTIVSAVLVIFVILRGQSKGETTLESIDQIEEELEQEQRKSN